MRIATLALLAALVAGCDRHVPQRYTSATFESDVLKSPTPVLVEFGSRSCGPCRQMEPILDRIEKDFRVARIDIEANPQLAARYDISSIPAMFIFVDGQIAAEFVGFREEAVLRNALTRLSAKEPARESQP